MVLTRMTEQVRLLLCHDCKSLEELPDYQGDPRGDTLLAVLTERHESAGIRHRGQLLRVDKKHWDSPSTRRAIENQIRESAGHTGLDTEFYATKNTFQEDALKCWQKHLRNPACNDYRSDKMILRPGTKADRKAAGMPESTMKTWLCSFCPVHSLVQQAKHDKYLK